MHSRKPSSVSSATFWVQETMIFTLTLSWCACLHICTFYINTILSAAGTGSLTLVLPWIHQQWFSKRSVLSAAVLLDSNITFSQHTEMNGKDAFKFKGWTIWIKYTSMVYVIFVLQKISLKTYSIIYNMITTVASLCAEDVCLKHPCMNKQLKSEMLSYSWFLIQQKHQ